MLLLKYQQERPPDSCVIDNVILVSLYRKQSLRGNHLP